jgi:hypothetical protein
MTIESETTTINNSRTSATNSDDVTRDWTEDNSLAYFIFKRSGLMFLTRIIISPFYLVKYIIHEINKCCNFFCNEYPSLSIHVCHLLSTILFAFLSVLSVYLMFIPSLDSFFIFVNGIASYCIIIFYMSDTTCQIYLYRFECVIYRKETKKSI